MLHGNNEGGHGGCIGVFYLVRILQVIGDFCLFCFYFGRGLVKERTWGYCHCPQVVSNVSKESVYIVGIGAHIYCLTNVSLEPCLPMDMQC